MSELVSELKDIYEYLQSFVDAFNVPAILKPLEALEESAIEAGKAWGHSWLGYQSRVYYVGLEPPPPGAHFSSEWGFEMGTRGGWKEFPVDAVETEIKWRAGNPDTTKAQQAAGKGQRLFEQKRDDAISILRAAKSDRDDPFLAKLLEEAEQSTVHARAEFIHHMQPAQFISRDAIAMSQGLWTPPHISVFVEVKSMREPKVACESLARIVGRVFSHLERTEKRHAKTERIGTNVFIGHGRSKEWKDLKDFISERMRLPWDEFNRKPVAGIPNAVRLSTMLDAAAIAFLVMTAEDEKSDGKMQARMNVVHEAGLFQGRLGFSRAIIMLEEGCEDFRTSLGWAKFGSRRTTSRPPFTMSSLCLSVKG